MKKHIFSPDILRASDIRGIFGQDLNPDDAYAIGRAFATIAKPENNVIAVGRDGRLSSPELAKSLIEGIVDTGVDVIDIGVCPTPMLYFSCYETDAKSGIMVTGSHNPSEYNGFKFVFNQGAFFGDSIKKIGKIAEDASYAEGQGRVNTLDISNKYVSKIVDEFIDIDNLKIVWDTGNGSCGDIVAKITEQSKTQNIIINQEIDGLFPNHHPDPTIPKNLEQLIAKVQESDADIGLGFDGDGDRIGVVLKNGQILWGDQFMIFLARDVLKTHKGAPIIADVKASNRFFEEVKKLGGSPLMWKTGHSFIKAKMVETKAPLAGEMSGHIFFADRYYGFDDALYTAARLIKYIGNSSKTLEELAKELPIVYNTPEIRIDCPENLKEVVLAKIKKELEEKGAKIDFTDGLRVSLKDGWWLLRRSNTQPIMVARCEGENKDALDLIKNELASYVANAGLVFPKI
ncbi:MAG: phosphoglucomutase/phosphomannomutase PgmG [Alphaproteobacteria bacterium]